MTESNVKSVLFDLGGVLIELGDLSDLRKKTRFAGDRDAWHRILGPWIHRFEMGQCSASEFSAGVVAEWKVDLTPERCLEILRDLPIGPYPGTTELLSEIQSIVEIGCLSNTNILHWDDQVARWPVLEMFTYRFLSFETGLRKPDQAIFAVARRLPTIRTRFCSWTISPQTPKRLALSDSAPSKSEASMRSRSCFRMLGCSRGA